MTMTQEAQRQAADELHARRDDAMDKAVKAFFEDGGDMHEFKHVVKQAINALPVSVLDVPNKVKKTLIAGNITHVGMLRHMDDRELWLIPGMGMASVRYVIAAFAPLDADNLFREERRVRSTDNAAPDQAATRNPV